MAIINSYPSITVTPSDLLLVSDVSEEGNPTKTTSVQGILDLAASGAGFVTSIVAGDGLTVDQSTGIVTISTNLSVSSSIPGLTFTNSPQGTLNIGISGTPLATQFLNGTGNWSTPAGGGGGGMTSWNITGDNAVSSVVSDGNTVDIEGGTKITTSAALTDTVTITHDATTTTPTTSASSPAAGGTFDAIDSITYDATGHITGFNTNTVTLPATGQVYQAGPGINFDATTTPDTIEVDYTGTNNVVNSAIAATSSEDPVVADDFIYGRAADNNAYKNTLKSLLQLIIRNTAIPEIFFSARSGAFINAGNTADTNGLSPFGAVSISSTTTGEYDISFATTQSDTDYIVNMTSENETNFLTYRIKSKATAGYTIEIFDASTNNPINGKVNVTMYSS